jgi:hypothetical protein
MFSPIESRTNKISTLIAMKFCPAYTGIRYNGSIVLWSITTRYEIMVSFATFRYVDLYHDYSFAFCFNIYLFHNVIIVNVKQIILYSLILFVVEVNNDICIVITWYMMMMTMAESPMVCPTVFTQGLVTLWLMELLVKQWEKKTANLLVSWLRR